MSNYKEIIINDVPLLDLPLSPRYMEKNDKIYFHFRYFGEQGGLGTDEIYDAVDDWNKESDTDLIINFSLDETLDEIFDMHGHEDINDKETRIMYRKIKRKLLETVEKINTALKKSPDNA